MEKNIYAQLYLIHDTHFARTSSLYQSINQCGSLMKIFMSAIMLFSQKEAFFPFALSFGPENADWFLDQHYWSKSIPLIGISGRARDHVSCNSIGSRGVSGGHVQAIDCPSIFQTREMDERRPLFIFDFFDSFDSTWSPKFISSICYLSIRLLQIYTAGSCQFATPLTTYDR